MISSKRAVQDLLSILEQAGIKDVVIAPGSRNAPFSISFYQNPSFNAISIVDERSAAFFAMGIAQQSHRPTVLICTSGTAALNFAPAIAEAYYQRIPLLVITADRPHEWIDQGEGQSIRQTNVYANYIKHSFEVVEDNGDSDLIWYNTRIINEALNTCTNGVPGPVHLNFPLRESLYNTVESTSAIAKRFTSATLVSSLSTENLRQLQCRLTASKRILILCGQFQPEEGLQRVLNELSLRSNVVVMSETHANLHGERIIATVDRLIMGFGEKEIASFQPDLLISIGSNIISRKVKAFLRTGQVEHWHVDDSGEVMDTYKKLITIIPMKPVDFLNAVFANLPTIDSTYSNDLLEKNQRNRESAAECMLQAEHSDLKATEEILKWIPRPHDIQMGNSAVVRYIQLFDPNPEFNYFGNRGVSGIDGCTSTAVGAAYHTGKPTTLISGDVAFLYDSNAFWNDQLPDHLKVIVLNNSGGGIFRIIEGPKSTEALETFFETKHQRSAKGVALMYDLPFMQVHHYQEIQAAMSWLYAQKGCAILEVMTPRLENDKALMDYFKHIKQRQIQA